MKTAMLTTIAVNAIMTSVIHVLLPLRQSHPQHRLQRPPRLLYPVHLLPPQDCLVVTVPHAGLATPAPISVNRAVGNSINVTVSMAPVMLPRVAFGLQEHPAT